MICGHTCKLYHLTVANLVLPRHRMMSHLTKHVLTWQISFTTTTPGSWTTIVWSIIRERQWSRNKFLPCVNLDLGVIICFVWNVIKSQYGSEELNPRHGLGVCALWPWPWRYDLESRSWHILGSWTAIVWNIIQIQYGSEELWPRHRVFVHCDLAIRHMIFGQGHGTPLDHGHWCVKY